MKNEHRPLFLALALYFLLTAALIVRIPLSGASSPDEGAHWEYINFIATHWRLPVFTGAAPPAPGYEFHQPPLYYALCAPLWAALPAGAEAYAARGLSLLCGLGTLIFVWLAARAVFPRSSIPTVAVLFAALSPLHQGVCAGVNNDGLAGLICAALFYFIALIWNDGATRKQAIWIGVLAALGLWTKLTSLTVSVVALGALFAVSRRKGQSMANLGVALGAMVVLALPLWIRNTLAYGDPLALKAFSMAATAGTPGYPQFSVPNPLFFKNGLDFFTYARGMVWMIFLTTWGFFGGSDTASRITFPLNPSGPVVTDLWLALPMLICLLAPLASVLGWRRLDEIGEKFEPVWKPWALATALVILAWMKFAYDHFSGGQARYMHAALVPIAIALAAGWVAMWGEKAGGKFASLVFGAVLVGLTLLNLFVWRTLA